MTLRRFLLLTLLSLIFQLAARYFADRLRNDPRIAVIVLDIERTE